MFTRYKTPALVNLDFKVTFTPKLLRKDLDLGLDAAKAGKRPTDAENAEILDQAVQLIKVLMDKGPAGVFEISKGSLELLQPPGARSTT